jgi:hypothetical protein
VEADVLVKERSDEGVDGVVDVVVGNGASVAGDAVVGLDVIQGLDIPGGGAGPIRSLSQ